MICLRNGMRGKKEVKRSSDNKNPCKEQDREQEPEEAMWWGGDRWEFETPVLTSPDKTLEAVTQQTFLPVHIQFTPALHHSVSFLWAETRTKLSQGSKCGSSCKYRSAATCMKNNIFETFYDFEVIMTENTVTLSVYSNNNVKFEYPYLDLKSGIEANRTRHHNWM